MSDKNMDTPKPEPVQNANFGKNARTAAPKSIPTDEEETRYLEDDDGNKLQGQEDNKEEDNEDGDLMELQDEDDLDDDRLMASGKTFEDETLRVDNETDDEEGLELEEEEEEENAENKILADKSKQVSH